MALLISQPVSYYVTSSFCSLVSSPHLDQSDDQLYRKLIIIHSLTRASFMAFHNSDRACLAVVTWLLLTLYSSTQARHFIWKALLAAWVLWLKIVFILRSKS